MGTKNILKNTYNFEEIINVGTFVNLEGNRLIIDHNFESEIRRCSWLDSIWRLHARAFVL